MQTSALEIALAVAPWWAQPDCVVGAPDEQKEWRRRSGPNAAVVLPPKSAGRLPPVCNMRNLMHISAPL